jgi:hypothetical protein
MATSMAAATIGHVKLLLPLRERDFALLWTGMTVVAGLRRDEDLPPLLGNDYMAGVGASAAESGSGTPAIS